jgi:peptidoglycan/LPS O-acetylase OafA/YrhL
MQESAIELPRELSPSSAFDELLLKGPATHHIPALDGLRGIAILSVLLFKSVEGYRPMSSAGLALCKLMGFGWMGVDLFFVLSGFLITGILLDTRNAPHFFRNFYARRTLRIFPLYYGMLIVSFVLIPHAWRTGTPGMERIVNNQGWLWLYMTNIAFLVKRTVFFDAGWLRFNHFWSLAIEEQFYLFWPLLVFLLSRRHLKIVCWAIVSFALCARVGLYFAHQRPGALFFPTPCRMDGLAMGALMAIAVREGTGVKALLPLARRGLLVAGSAIVAISIWHRETTGDDMTTLTIGFTIVAAFASCLLMICLDPSPASWWRQALESRFLRALGKFSYGGYVLHMTVFWALDKTFPIDRFVSFFHVEPAGMILYAATAITLVMTAAFLSWHSLEKHFLKAKRLFAYGT